MSEDVGSASRPEVGEGEDGWWLEPRTLDQLRLLPLWSTRLRVVIDHMDGDRVRYTVTYEGCLGNISWGAKDFSVCFAGEGQWVRLSEPPFSSRKVSVFEVMS